MKNIWLVYNPRSKSSDEALVAQLEQIFTEAQRPITRKLMVGEDDLPDAFTVHAAGVELVIVLSGDGTINAAAQALDGWDGVLLVLPGGTMNLLARALHDQRTAPEIAQAFLSGKGAASSIPVITGEGLTAYAGVIAGPSSAWADVREDMRNLDLVSAGTNAAKAVTATFNEPCVALEGHDNEYPAIYLEPREDHLQAFGVRAETAADLISHGWAWLQGDFREGPSDALPADQQVTLTSAAATLGLLVDGEKAQGKSPATFRLGRSNLRFYSARGGIQWS